MKIKIVDLLVDQKYAVSRSIARRRIAQEGVFINGDRVLGAETVVEVHPGDAVRIGQHIARIIR